MIIVYYKIKAVVQATSLVVQDEDSYAFVRLFAEPVIEE